jgi:hypothetical protein
MTKGCSMAAFECMKQADYKVALEQLTELREVAFVMDGDSVDFVEHVWKMRHIHWPIMWGERIAELHDRYVQ